MMWSLAVPVKVLENKGATDAMARSADLTKGDRGRIFVIWLLFVVLRIRGGLVVAVARGNGGGGGFDGWGCSAVRADGRPRCWFRLSFRNAWSVLWLPSRSRLLYYDERVRKEAFDLQLMMMTLDASALPASPAQAGA